MRYVFVVPIVSTHPTITICLRFFTHEFLCLNIVVHWTKQQTKQTKFNEAIELPCWRINCFTSGLFKEAPKFVLYFWHYLNVVDGNDLSQIDVWSLHVCVSGWGIHLHWLIKLNISFYLFFHRCAECVLFGSKGIFLSKKWITQQ